MIPYFKDMMKKLKWGHGLGYMSIRFDMQLAGLYGMIFGVDMNEDVEENIERLAGEWPKIEARCFVDTDMEDQHHPLLLAAERMRLEAKGMAEKFPTPAQLMGWGPLGDVTKLIMVDDQGRVA
ncbi:hypothetical protein KVT40_007637 [Elsinoe batatas]|uniref:Uncharacterized protein n=1 Tax=Elsinoe batatas TaxID=2601811 RepID=A0A8K0PAF9_9PEZI|nr:hypothetical protein KVT40_007637 [Elsinoe batatas]